MYYGHASWIAIALFAAMFGVRALSSQRRRGNRSGRGFPGSSGRGFPGSSLTDDRGAVPGGPGASSSGISSTGTPAGWFTDPFFRHEQRYWSGAEWTAHVSDGGVPASDPPPDSARPDGS